MASSFSTARFFTSKNASAHLRCILPVLLPRHSRFSTRTNPVHAKRYTPDHEWVDLAPGATVGTVGISSFAAHALGDVVYVETPSLWEDVSAGDAIGTVESVKSVSDIKAPVTGKIVNVNILLEEKPVLMGTKPEDSGDEGGWIAKIEVGEKGKGEWEALMGEREYEAFIKE